MGREMGRETGREPGGLAPSAPKKNLQTHCFLCIFTYKNKGKTMGPIRYYNMIRQSKNPKYLLTSSRFIKYWEFIQYITYCIIKSRGTKTFQKTC